MCFCVGGCEWELEFEEEGVGFEISLWDGKVIKVSGWERKWGEGCLEDWELGEGLGN